VAPLAAMLIVAALVVAYWPVILTVAAAIAAVTWAVRARNRHAERVKAERRRVAEIAVCAMSGTSGCWRVVSQACSASIILLQRDSFATHASIGSQIGHLLA
jgi:hypothetical protein